MEMTRLPILALVAVGGATAALAPSSAQAPAAIAQAQPGIWEVTGWPGSRAPVRLCVADVRALGRFEHRGRRCATQVAPSGTSSVAVDYQCGAAGFGSSRVDMITPRSLRIRTQGISNGLPFHYLIQARRVGECAQSRRRH